MPGSIKYLRKKAVRVIPDAVPNSFSFTAQTGVALSSWITSNTVTISGINVPATLTGSQGAYGADYQIDNGTWTSVLTPGTISNGQTIKVRLSSPSASNASASCSITIGGVGSTFQITTVAGILDWVQGPHGTNVNVSISGDKATAVGSGFSALSVWSTSHPIPADGHWYYWEYTGDVVSSAAALCCSSTGTPTNSSTTNSPPGSGIGAKKVGNVWYVFKVNTSGVVSSGGTFTAPNAWAGVKFGAAGGIGTTVTFLPYGVQQSHRPTSAQVIAVLGATDGSGSVNPLIA